MKGYQLRINFTIHEVQDAVDLGSKAQRSTWEHQIRDLRLATLTLPSLLDNETHGCIRLAFQLNCESS